MKITRELIVLLALLLAMGMTAYRHMPALHPASCLCDTCHEQYDGERGE